MRSLPSRLRISGPAALAAMLLAAPALAQRPVATTQSNQPPPSQPAPQPTPPPVTAAPATPPAGQAPTGDGKVLASQVETYLNSVTTLKATFDQRSPGGKVARGTFSLKRPGKLRFQYDEPSRNFVVADGSYIYFWDDDLKEQSQASIGETLADFILRPRINFSGELQVTGVNRVGDEVRLDVVQAADPGAGRLTIILNAQPLGLKGWRIIDGQGRETYVGLTNIQAGMALSDEPFYFRRPRR